MVFFFFFWGGGDAGKNEHYIALKMSVTVNVHLYELL